MMGYSHTVSAAAGWLILAETGVVQVPDTPTLIVTTLACAGAGMLPDIDHHNGSIANSIPPLSRWLARVVGAISGGHRKGTHSLIGLIAFWAIAYFSIQLTYQGVPWVSLILAGFSGGLALRVLGAPGGWIGAIILGYAAYTAQPTPLGYFSRGNHTPHRRCPDHQRNSAVIPHHPQTSGCFGTLEEKWLHGLTASG